MSSSWSSLCPGHCLDSVVMRVSAQTSLPEAASKAITSKVAPNTCSLPLAHVILPLPISTWPRISLLPLFVHLCIPWCLEWSQVQKEEFNKYMSNEEMNDSDEAVQPMIHNPVHPSCPHHLCRDSPFLDQCLLAVKLRRQHLPLYRTSYSNLPCDSDTKRTEKPYKTIWQPNIYTKRPQRASR